MARKTRKLFYQSRMVCKEFQTTKCNDYYLAHRAKSPEQVLNQEKSNNSLGFKQKVIYWYGFKLYLLLTDAK